MGGGCQQLSAGGKAKQLLTGPPVFYINKPMKVLVTGATGFVGSALVRKLLGRGYDVVALVRKDGDHRNLDGLGVETATGDLRDMESLRRAMKGCDGAYHAAADYTLWTKDPASIYQTNVEGTKNVLAAAREAGVGRVVYTSTVGALGNPGDGTPGTEDTPVTLSDMVGHYKRSKFMAEQEALKFATEGLPVVVVNPSTPVGPRDIKPTPTGKMILDFINGKMAAYLDTGLNLVDVDDVAEGHILAMEKGVPGRKYILGNRDMTLKEIFGILSGLTGIPAPRVRLPYAFVYPIALVSTAISDHITGRPPLAPIEAVRMARKFMYFDPSKAVRELGMPQSPVEDALARAVSWFRDNGYSGRVR
jgi:dihydroflavonol-4-reductase